MVKENKKQWDKLPIGTVLEHKGLFYFIEIKESKTHTLICSDNDPDESDISGESFSIKNTRWNLGYAQMLDNLQLAPKWIQELFKIK